MLYIIYVYSYIYIYIYAYLFMRATHRNSAPGRSWQGKIFAEKLHTCEEFARLAETGLARNDKFKLHSHSLT